MLKAIIIDDEPDCIRLLTLLLNEHCPLVQILAECPGSSQGLHAIREFDPDIVFLDIEMPEMNGFTLLEQLGEFAFSLIFITAYNEFALKAFRYSALDYLLKPLDKSELIDAVNKVEKRNGTHRSQIEMLRDLLKYPQLPKKIAVPSQSGVAFVALSDLIYCEAESNYTKLFVTGGKSYLLSKTLREVQKVLEERNFLRIHRQFLVNLDQIKMYHRGDASYVEMNGGANIPVSKNQKDNLVQRFGWI